MNYTELIAALSLEMRLDLTGRDLGQDGCTIRFDDTVDVTIAPQGVQAVAEWAAPALSDVAHLHAVLATAPGVARARLFAALLQLHVFGAVTDDAYFGFDAERDRVTLSRTLPLRELDTARAVRSVASFVDQCHRWNAALPGLAASER